MAKTAPLIKPYVVRHMGTCHEFSLVNPWPVEVNGASFVESDLVEALTTGNINKLSADGNVMGFALSASTGTAGTKVPIMALDPHSICLFNLHEEDQAGNHHTFALADLYHTYRAATNGTYMGLDYDTIDGNDNQFFVIGVHPDYTVGDIDVWVYAMPVVSKLGLNNELVP
jgi:hypothetical protein